MDIKKIESQNAFYERLKLLGQGAFGKAYLVKQKATGILCVIKQMNIAEMSKAEQNETFKEAKILEALNHPNIVKFKEVYVTTNSKLNIVMEYADGGDLSKKIKEQKATQKLFDEATILDWFTQMCLAIKHVHDRKIIHRDIKGQNVFITKNSTVKLGDFGIAKILNKTMEKAKTVVGTPYYLSPEIIENKPYTNKSDIWSLGVVLYQLCALTPPFNANSLQYLALKIVKGSYSPITGPYSKQLKTLVADMLNLDPNKRPSADQILKIPIIINRIQKFLTQTQNKVQFSHTVLHDFKLGFNKDKIKIQNSQASKQQIDAKQVQKQRLLLKQKQAQMQRLREQKKKQQKALEEKRKRQQQQARIQRAQAEDRKREQMRKFQQKQQQYREQQARIQYERIKQYEQQQKVNNLKKRQIADKAKRQKQQQEKRYAEFARQQYFRNKAIKQNAERRANDNNYTPYQQYPETNNIQIVPKEPINLPKPNFHYKKQTEQQRPVSGKNQIYQKPTSAQSQRTSSRQRPISRQKPRSKWQQPEVNDQMLMNAYMNPNFQKKQQQTKQIPTPDIVSNVKKQPIKKQQKQDPKKNDLKKVIQQGRAQMRLDRQAHKNTDKSTQISEPQIIIKQSPKKQRDPKQDIKTFKGNKWNKQSPPLKIHKVQTQQIQQILQQNKLLEQMINKQIQAQQKSQQQLNDIIKQLQKIVGNVVDNIEQLPSVSHIQINDNQRKDDFTEPQKDSQFQQKTVYEGDDLQYFSDYSKLENLRMNLEDVFGTETFVKLYRIIEKQFEQNGVEGLQHDILRKKIDFIDEALFSQYITMLMTLIVIENKINQDAIIR